MLPNIRDYDQLYREFRWPKLARYNIGVDVCDKWAAQEPDRLAILNIRADGKTENISFGWLRETSNRLANTLARARRRARRPRRDAAAADAGSGRRTYRDLQARRGRGAAGDPVRRRCAELPAAERGREGRHHQRAGAREAQPKSAASCRSSRSCSRSTGRATARSACTRRSRARPPTSRRPRPRRTIPR